MKKLEKDLQIKEEKMKKDQAEYLNKLREENAELREKHRTAEAKLEQQQQLTKKVDDAYYGMSTRTEALQAQLVRMQQDTEIAEREDEYL
jgi:hypothetical protein